MHDTELLNSVHRKCGEYSLFGISPNLILTMKNIEGTHKAEIPSLVFSTCLLVKCFSGKCQQNGTNTLQLHKSASKMELTHYNCIKVQSFSISKAFSLWHNDPNDIKVKVIGRGSG